MKEQLMETRESKRKEFTFLVGLIGVASFLMIVMKNWPEHADNFTKALLTLFLIQLPNWVGDIGVAIMSLFS